MKKTEFSEEKRLKIKELAREGKTAGFIAKILKVDRKALRRLAEEQSFSFGTDRIRKKTYLTEEQQETVIRMAKEGYNQTQIGQKLQISHTTVNKFCKDHGVSLTVGQNSRTETVRKKYENKNKNKESDVDKKQATMCETTGFLTEEKLGRVLEQIFPDIQIFRQWRVDNRIFDYRFIIHNTHPLFCLFEDHCVYEESVCDSCEEGDCEQCDIFHYQQQEEMEVEVFVEYDGSYHYEKNSQVRKDTLLGGKMGKSYLSSGQYLIRMPYWIQLTPDVTKFMFGLELDFSENFPHGFISKNCRTPDNFCALGDDRFVSELQTLKETMPKVYEDVVLSLKNKDRNGRSYSDNVRRILYDSK